MLLNDEAVGVHIYRAYTEPVHMTRIVPDTGGKSKIRWTDTIRTQEGHEQISPDVYMTKSSL